MFKKIKDFLNKNQNKAKPREIKSNDNPYLKAQDFIQNAEAFIINENQNIRNQNKLLILFTGICLGIAVLSVLAVIFLTPLKKVETVVIRVDNATGKAEVLSLLDKKVETHGEVTDKYYIAQYVNYRESYDWETINTMYKATKLMSNDRVASEYSKIYGTENKLSPVNTLKENYRILVEVQSINFLGEVAQVRFTKTKLPINNADEARETSEYVVSLTYTYENTPETEKERLLNPLGMKITSYQLTKIK